MTKVDKNIAELILADFRKAVLEISTRYGLDAGTIRVAYRATSVDLKSSLRVKGGPSKESENYLRWRNKLGLPPLGHPFVHGGVDYKTVGLKIGGKFKNLVIERQDNKKLYKLPLAVFNMTINNCFKVVRK